MGLASGLGSLPNWPKVEDAARDAEDKIRDAGRDMEYEYRKEKAKEKLD